MLREHARPGPMRMLEDFTPPVVLPKYVRGQLKEQLRDKLLSVNSREGTLMGRERKLAAFANRFFREKVCSTSLPRFGNHQSDHLAGVVVNDYS